MKELYQKYRWRNSKRYNDSWGHDSEIVEVVDVVRIINQKMVDELLIVFKSENGVETTLSELDFKIKYHMVTE